MNSFIYVEHLIKIFIFDIFRLFTVFHTELFSCIIISILIIYYSVKSRHVYYISCSLKRVDSFVCLTGFY